MRSVVTCDNSENIPDDLLCILYNTSGTFNLYLPLHASSQPECSKSQNNLYKIESYPYKVQIGTEFKRKQGAKMELLV